MYVSDHTVKAWKHNCQLGDNNDNSQNNVLEEMGASVASGEQQSILKKLHWKVLSEVCNVILH